VLAVAGVWIAARAAFWVGYAGADDQYYARYAYLLHRPPMNHMEFRLPLVGAMGASFRLLGPTELAACLPTLLGSAALLAAVAWFVDWPRICNWQTNGSVLLAATIPLDVTFCTVPGPGTLVGGLTALGSVAILKGNRLAGIAGALLLTLAFMTHLLNFWYVAIFCFTALAFDWRRFWVPVAACVVLSGALLAGECATYEQWLGDAGARFRTFGTQTGEGGIPVDARAGGSHLRFFLMPLQILLLSKHFGVGLAVMTLAGFAAWKRLQVEARVLLLATFLFWFWLGYGTNVPWAYRPPSRGMHYYTPLILGVCALGPMALGLIFQKRRWVAQVAVAGMLGLHLLALLAGGRWGQNVDVSRELLAYCRQHPQRTFLADVYTVNEMYLLGGFALPENVVCVQSENVRHDLLANKEPQGPQVEFPAHPGPDAILMNHERLETPPEPAFREFVKAARESRRIQGVEHQLPRRYRPLFVPLLPVVGEKEFMIRSNGGEVRKVAQ